MLIIYVDACNLRPRGRCFIWIDAPWFRRYGSLVKLVTFCINQMSTNCQDGYKANLDIIFILWPGYNSRTRPTQLENHAEIYLDVDNDQIGTIEIYPDHEKYPDSAIEAQSSFGPNCSIILRLVKIVCRCNGQRLEKVTSKLSFEPVTYLIKFYSNPRVYWRHTQRIITVT